MYISNLLTTGPLNAVQLVREKENKTAHLVLPFLPAVECSGSISGGNRVTISRSLYFFFCQLRAEGGGREKDRCAPLGRDGK